MNSDEDIIKREENYLIKKISKKISARILVIPQKNANRTILFETLGHAIYGSLVLMTDKGIYVIIDTDSVSDLLMSVKKVEGVDEAIYA